MDTKKLKKRNEIDPAYQWNIDTMYQSMDQVNADIEEIQRLAGEFKALSGKFTKNGTTLLEAIKVMESIDRKLEHLYVYSRMKLDEDNSNSIYQELNGKVSTLMGQVGADMAFFTPELMELTNDQIQLFYEEEAGLAPYKFFLDDAFKLKPYTLSKAEEALLAQLSPVTDCAHKTYTMLNNADIKFGTIKDENGVSHQLTHGNMINFMESHCREIREEAFTKIYETYKSQINTIGTLYANSVTKGVTMSKIRGFDGVMERALFGNDIPTSVYNNLIDVVRKHLPALHKYMALRKEVLGLSQLHMYDVYVPLVKIEDKEISFDQAVQMINQALKPLGQEYLDIMNKGIQEGWVDVYENEGKTSGAYSFGSYDSYPFILMNYTSKLTDVLTLIHEMGHSMHSYFTRKNQPFIYGDYSIFVAEVASTVNECLLMEHLLANEEDHQMRLFLINRFIEEFRTTLFRQTMFAEFELITHKYVEQGGALTPKWLSEQYSKLNQDYFGPSMEQDQLIQYEWARIPHFYRPFYVYQYATGFSAANAISSKILKEGPSAAKDYLKFLSLGSSMYPVDELKVAGVDMSQPEAIEAAMNKFTWLVDLLEKELSNTAI